MENLNSKEDQIKKILYSRINKLLIFLYYYIKWDTSLKKICQKNVVMNMTENISKKNDKITGKNINLDKISLGNPEKKNSRKFKFKIIPILYEEIPFQIVECGKKKIFSFHNKSFSVGLTVDKENEDYLKSIEKRISDVYDDELNLIKSSHGHLKVYAKRFAIEGQIQTPVRILSNGKKRLVNDFQLHWGSI